ncbi:sensor histidine kinase, partial [Mariniphaga sediminis]|uniref:sensor histidine kinase n=1 Tax=Mariniphaga sediminis TaxID=1628158 RepID=UPI0035650043
MKEITHKLKLLLYDSKKGIFENKVFSIVTLVGAITCFATFVININILTENYLLINWVIALLGITLSIFFYLSAFKGITQPLIFPFQILVSLILVFSWFYFQGIEGSAPLFFFLAIFLLIYSDNRKRYWTISVSFIFLAVVLVGLYFVKHEWFLDYIDDESRIIDLSTSFIISFTAFSFTVVWLKKKFDLERARTQQKNIELKKSKTELQELIATKDKFFSIISHDLKIPFSGVIGFSELLIEKVQEKNYEKIESYARNIYNSSQQAMELLLNLLDWSRSQTGRMTYRPINFDLIETVETTINLFENIAAKKSIEIKA